LKGIFREPKKPKTFIFASGFKENYFLRKGLFSPLWGPERASISGRQKKGQKRKKKGNPVRPALFEKFFI